MIERLIVAFRDRLPAKDSEESFLETLYMRPAIPQEAPTLQREMYSGGRFARQVLWERTSGIVAPLNLPGEPVHRIDDIPLLCSDI